MSNQNEYRDTEFPEVLTHEGRQHCSVVLKRHLGRCNGICPRCLPVIFSVLGEISTWVLPPDRNTRTQTPLVLQLRCSVWPVYKGQIHLHKTEDMGGSKREEIGSVQNFHLPVKAAAEVAQLWRQQWLYTCWTPGFQCLVAAAAAALCLSGHCCSMFLEFLQDLHQDLL